MHLVLTAVNASYIHQFSVHHAVNKCASWTRQSPCDESESWSIETHRMQWCARGLELQWVIEKLWLCQMSGARCQLYESVIFHSSRLFAASSVWVLIKCSTFFQASFKCHSLSKFKQLIDLQSSEWSEWVSEWVSEAASPHRALSTEVCDVWFWYDDMMLIMMKIIVKQDEEKKGQMVVLICGQMRVIAQGGEWGGWPALSRELLSRFLLESGAWEELLEMFWLLMEI